MVVLGVGMPEFRSLPVDCADEAANHGTRRLLHFREAKIRNLGSSLLGDENIGRFTIAVDDGRLVSVEILQASCYVKH